MLQESRSSRLLLSPKVPWTITTGEGCALDGLHDQLLKVGPIAPGNMMLQIDDTNYTQVSYVYDPWGNKLQTITYQGYATSTTAPSGPARPRR